MLRKHSRSTRMSPVMTSFILFIFISILLFVPSYGFNWRFWNRKRIVFNLEEVKERFRNLVEKIGIDPLHIDPKLLSKAVIAVEIEGFSMLS